MKKLLLALALLLIPSAALAQCNGVFGANQVCGSLAGGVPGPVASTSFPPGALIVGTTVISGGTPNGLLWNNAGVLGNLVTGNNGVLVTSGAGVPFITTALPSGLTIPGFAPLASPALTGVPTAPTAAPGTNTTQLATTAFVTAAIPATCNGAGAFLVGVGGSSQCSTTANSSATISGGPLTITGAASSLVRGISVSLTGPASGSSASGPASYNAMVVTNGFSITGPAGSTNGLLNAALRALYVELDDSQTGTTSSTATFLIVNTGATAGDKVGLAGASYSNFNSNPNFMLGLGGRAQVGPLAVQGWLVGSQLETSIQTGAVVTNRLGLLISSDSQAQATTYDTAIGVDALQNSGPFKNLLAIGSPANAFAPIDSTGSIIVAINALTVTNFCNCTNITVSGNILAFPFAGLAGNGNATFGIPIASLNAAYNVQVSGTSKGSVGLGVQTNSTGGFSAVQVVNSTAVAEIDIIASEPLRNSTFLGQTTGSWSEIVVSSSNGLLFGTVGNVPILFGTNNTERMRLLAGLAVGLATDPGSGIISVLTGFRINNLAASGNVLRGNGTNFVSAQLAAADLSNGTTGSGAVVLATSPTITTPSITTSATLSNNGINATSSDGYVLQNTTAATGGQVQWSPRVHLTGTQFVSGGASQNVEWFVEIQPTNNVAAASLINNLVFSSQVAGGSLGKVISFQATGAGGNTALIFNSPSTKNANLIYQDGGANVWYFQNNGTADTFQIFNSDSNGNTTVFSMTQAGLITISNTIVAPNLASDAGLTDTTLCWKNTATTGTFLKGSGTLGICLGTSGEQFKNIVGLMEPVLDLVAELPIRTYYYKSGYGDSGEHLQRGPTAQDVARVFPDLVRYGERGEAINYDYGALLFITVRAVQELRADNDNLRADLARFRKATNQ